MMPPHSSIKLSMFCPSPSPFHYDSTASYKVPKTSDFPPHVRLPLFAKEVTKQVCDQTSKLPQEQGERYITSHFTTLLSFIPSLS
jgi:hypothetical protein